MNIVFVSKECPPSPYSSGIGTYVWETGRALAQRAHTVTIVAASDDMTESSCEPMPGLRIIRLPDDERATGPRGIVTRTLKAPFVAGMAYRERVANCLDSLVGEGRADIVEFPGFRGESIAWKSRAKSVPMVARMHGFTAGVDGSWKDQVSATRRLQTRWERQEFCAADTITVVARHLAAPVASRFGEQRIRTVHNGIDSAWWAKHAADSKEFGGGEDILFVGGLTKRKGVTTLIEASEILRSEGWKGRLLLAGRGSREFKVFSFTRWRRMSEWVVLLGLMPREKLVGLYRNAGLCCFPSLLEPFSYTCLEAMAAGGLVVGSSRTGMAEIIDGSCGFLSPPGDVSGLVATLSAVLALSDPDRRRIRAAAQRKIHDWFDNEVILPQLLGVYKATIASHGN